MSTAHSQNNTINSIIRKVETFLHDILPTPPNYDGEVAVALSGGPDSVCLLSVCLKLGFNVTALHCNFHLRGEESNHDQEFVENLCKTHGTPVKVRSFDVHLREKETGESTEMAARALRYDWFAEECSSHGFRYLFTGHHRDDAIETFFLNAVRGTGIDGLTGIPPVRPLKECHAICLRPMLCLSRKEILDYLSAAGLSYVTDSTNKLCDVNRNKFRNRLIPDIEHDFPAMRETLSGTMDNIRRDNQLFKALIADKRQQYTDADGALNVADLLDRETEGVTLLFHLLDKEIDFPRLKIMAESLSNSGKIYQGKRNRYLLDRGKLIPLNVIPSAADKMPMADEAVPLALTKLAKQGDTLTIPLSGSDSIIFTMVSPEDFRPERDPYQAWFDLDALRQLSEKGKILFRHPRTGDRMRPFGIKGSKLLSDIFSDLKLPVTAKPQVYIVDSPEGILWVPGIRNSALCTVKKGEVPSDSTAAANIQVVHARFIGDFS